MTKINNQQDDFDKFKTKSMIQALLLVKNINESSKAQIKKTICVTYASTKILMRQSQNNDASVTNDLNRIRVK